MISCADPLRVCAQPVFQAPALCYSCAVTCVTAGLQVGGPSQQGNIPYMLHNAYHTHSQ